MPLTQTHESLQVIFSGKQPTKLLSKLYWELNKHSLIAQAILELNKYSLIDIPPFSLVWLQSHGVSNLQMFVILRGFVLSVHINRGLVLSNFVTVTVIKDIIKIDNKQSKIVYYLAYL